MNNIVLLGIQCGKWIKDLLPILIPCAVTILGFIISTKNLSKSFLNEIKKGNSEDKKRVYEEISELLDEALMDRKIFLTESYVQRLTRNKSKAKLYGSSEMLKCYERYYEYVCEQYQNYVEFYNKNDPTRNIEEDDEGHQINAPDEMAIERFELRRDSYISNNETSVEKFKKYSDSIWKVMREDIKTDD